MTGPREALDDPTAYGRAFAAVYDDWYRDLGDADGPRRLLDKWPLPGGPVVEFGVGTGRLAEPLAAGGYRVIGLDASVAMLRSGQQRLHRCEARPVAGDMASVPLRDGVATAVVCGFNTLFNVSTVPRQRSVVAEAARVVRPGGIVVFEINDVALPSSTTSSPSTHSGATVTTVSDATTRVVTGHHLEPDGIERRWRIRCCTPTEVTKWALMVGLSPVATWGSWDGGPPTDLDRRIIIFQLSE